MTKKPVSIAVLGAGRMGALYARLVEQHPLARLAALTCKTEQSAERLKKEFDVPVLASDDFSELGSVAESIDGAVIATPEWAHLEPLRWCTGRNLPTLLEKPMAGSLSDSRAIADFAETLGDRFMLCHVVRFDPRYAAMQRAVSDGAVGRVRQMHARRNADQVAAERILGKCHPAYWLTPHDVDIMRWITGAEVSWVYANYADTGHAASDGLFVDLGFTDGSMGRIENSWATPPLPGARNCLFDVLGDDGAVEVNAWQQGINVRSGNGLVSSPNTTEIAEVDGRIVGAFANMIDAFVGVANGSRKPPATLEDGMATMLASDAIARSLETGRRIKL